MKTRNDFVSNSSSCSFIVNEPIKLKDALEKIGGSYYYGLSKLESYVECKAEDKHLFKEETNNFQNGYEYDGIYSFSLNTDEIFELDDTKLKAVTSIKFECDDFDCSSTFLLSVLKKALENMGISVDSSNSERSLLLEGEDNYDGHEFIRNLCKIAFSSNIK